MSQAANIRDPALAAGGRRLSVMYAIVKVGGKQYRVEKGDTLLVDRMPEDEGAKVALEPLMFRGDARTRPSSRADDLGQGEGRGHGRRATSAARRSTC